MPSRPPIALRRVVLAAFVITAFVLPAFVIFGLVLAGAAAAQPHGTDILATTTAGGILYRIHPSGSWSPITSFASLPNMVCMDHNNSDIVVVTYQPASLVVVDSSVGRVVRTIWNGNGLYRGDYFAPLHDGSFVVAGTTLTPTYTGKLVRVYPNGSHTTIHVGAPLGSPQGLLQDLNNGHLAVSDLTSGTLYDFTLGGQITTLWKPSSASMMRFFSMTQDHFDGSLIIGPGGISSWIGVARWSRRTGKPSILVGPSQVNNANAICFDRGTGTGAVITGSGPVHRISRAGQMLSTIGNLPWNNTGMCFDRGRNIVTLRAGSPNYWTIQLDFPNRTGYGYLIGMSMSGFAPGIPVDSRVIPLVPDKLLELTLKGSIDHLLKGRTGVLGFGGRATAALDLRGYGKLLSGVPIWLAAVVVDVRAPSGLAVISKPVIIPLD